MKLVLLGTEGAGHFPRPCCFCSECRKARARYFERTGPALIETTKGILFDTPEEISLQLNRERIKKVSAVFYTHWHPDHVQGQRVFEHIGHRGKFQDGKRQKSKKITVFIPKDALPDFKKFQSHIFFYEKRGWVKFVYPKDRERIKFGKITVIPVNLKRKDRTRFVYVLMQGKKKVLYAPCSIFEMKKDPLFCNADLAFFESGWLGNPKKARAVLHASHVFQDHISFEETLALSKELGIKKTILMHFSGARHITTELMQKKLKEKKAKNVFAGKEGQKFTL